MNFKYLLPLALVLFVSCIGVDYETDPSVSQAGQSKMKAFLADFTSSVGKKDWNALSDLHWSGGKFSPEELEQEFAPTMSNFEGAIQESELQRQLEYNESDFKDYLDREEIPGDVKLLRGEAEFYLISDNPNDPDFYFWVLLCEEDGKFKVFKYIETYTE